MGNTTSNAHSSHSCRTLKFGRCPDGSWHITQWDGYPPFIAGRKKKCLESGGLDVPPVGNANILDSPPFIQKWRCQAGLESQCTLEIQTGIGYSPIPSFWIKLVIENSRKFTVESQVMDHYLGNMPHLAYGCEYTWKQRDSYYQVGTLSLTVVTVA